ncbi:MAG: hypothetical protein GY801_03910 [bacterium]|nr:hypothetical protein [bacterium]
MSGGLPYMPIVIGSQPRAFKVSALVDSGSTINVLPYRLGLALGAVWEEQTRPTTLTGNLADVPAFVVYVLTQIPPLEASPLIFAWTQSDRVPPILGKMNFFLEYDVHFFASQGYFEVAPRQEKPNILNAP